MKTVFVSFETLRKPKGVDVFVPAWSMEAREWRAAVVGALKGEGGRRMSLPFCRRKDMC